MAWGAVGIEGDKTLGSIRVSHWGTPKLFCARYSPRTELAATLLGHSSLSESREQPLLQGWHGEHPGWDRVLSCFCLAQGWQVPVSPPFAVGRNRTLSTGLGAQLSLPQGKASPYLGRSSLLELCRWSSSPRAAVLCSLRDVETHVRAPPHVEAHELLQGCCLNNLKASCSTKGTGFPVLWGADGISKKPLQGKWSSDLHHAFPENAVGLGFLQQQAWVKLQSIDVSVQLFQLCCLLLLSCTK